MQKRIKSYIYFILLSNVAIAGFQIAMTNQTTKIILASYTMLSLLFAIIYIKKA